MRPNERLDSTSTRSGERLNLKGEVIVSFFNELDTGKELCSRFRFDPQIVVSFFNELATEKKTMLASVSFFNELAFFNREEKLCSWPLFHFLTSLPQRRETMLVMPPA
jgi:hypothetical protein